jgi:hypothetical protein
MSATVIKLQRRSDPAFRAMAEQLLAVYFRDGDEAFLADCRRLDKHGPRLAQAIRDLLDEAGSPR